jgi:hypothetical protein
MSRFDRIRAELIKEVDEYIAKAGSRYKLAQLLRCPDNYVYQQREKGGIMALLSMLERCDELKWEKK